jgi:photosystem II stability/assembly factor-like uncharacterized protein
VCCNPSSLLYAADQKVHVCTSQSNPSEENAKLHHPAVAADRTFNRNGRHRKKEKKRATILEIENTRQSWQKKLDDDANLRSFLRNLFFLFNQKSINLESEKSF